MALLNVQIYGAFPNGAFPQWCFSAMVPFIDGAFHIWCLLTMVPFNNCAFLDGAYNDGTFCQWCLFISIIDIPRGLKVMAY